MKIIILGILGMLFMQELYGMENESLEVIKISSNLTNLLAKKNDTFKKYVHLGAKKVIISHQDALALCGGYSKNVKKHVMRLDNTSKMVKVYKDYKYMPMGTDIIAQTKQVARNECEKLVKTTFDSYNLSADKLEHYITSWDALQLEDESAFLANYYIDSQKNEGDWIIDNINDSDDAIISLDKDSVPLLPTNNNRLFNDLLKKYAYCLVHLQQENPNLIKLTSNTLSIRAAHLRSLKGIGCILKGERLVNTKIEYIDLSSNYLQKIDIAFLREFFPNAIQFIYDNNPLVKVNFLETRMGDTLSLKTQQNIKLLDIESLGNIQPINIKFSASSLSDQQKSDIAAINSQMREKKIFSRICARGAQSALFGFGLGALPSLMSCLATSGIASLANNKLILIPTEFFVGFTVGVPIFLATFAFVFDKSSIEPHDTKGCFGNNCLFPNPDRYRPHNISFWKEN